jgi:hypothetical protein
MTGTSVGRAISPGTSDSAGASEFTAVGVGTPGPGLHAPTVSANTTRIRRFVTRSSR